MATITSEIQDKKSPIVSVIIIAYNQEKTIRQTIESVLNQKCNFFFEIIIGDDCSTDSTREICLEYQNKNGNIISLLFQETNQGVVKNYLDTIRLTRGKYVAQCAGDDYWNLSSKLQLQFDFLEQHENCGIVHTNCDILNVKNGKILKNYANTSKVATEEGNLTKSIFQGKTSIFTPTVVFRKELFDKYIPQYDYINLKFPVEDWPTWVILSKYSTIGYLPMATATYRRGHESLSNISDYDKIEKKLSLEHIMYKYVCNLFPEDLLYNEQGYSIYINTVMLSLAYKKNDYPKAKQYANALHLKKFRKLKTICATTWVTFNFFNTMKRLVKN